MNVSVPIRDLLSREFLHQGEVKALRDLHAGELSALEAYDLAIDKIKSSELKEQIRDCRNSHKWRTEILKERLHAIGETPRNSGGWWGIVSKFVEGSAAIISDRIAISVLAAGEDFGLDQYRLHLNDLDSDSFAIVESDLLPAQVRTYKAIHSICAGMRSPEHQAKENGH